MTPASLHAVGGQCTPPASAAPEEDRSRRRNQGSGPHRQASTGTRQRLRVLIVEDDADARDLYAWCMRAAGWVAMTVADGAEALAAARTFEPDVIVMDFALPIMDGFETTRLLKSDALTRDIPVVGCTAYIHSESAAREAGCEVFVTKPCEPEELRRVLEGLVTGRSGGSFA